MAERLFLCSGSPGEAPHGSTRDWGREPGNRTSQKKWVFVANTRYNYFPLMRRLGSAMNYFFFFFLAAFFFVAMECLLEILLPRVPISDPHGVTLMILRETFCVVNGKMQSRESAWR
jgi:hypothetical protein